jgi:hypothetical protein
VHQIVDVCHVPRKINVVADGLSCRWEGQEPQEGEGNSWTVNPDRDETVGLTNDVLLTLNTESNEQIEALRVQLKNERLFIEVIDAITVWDSVKTVRD